jgi:hypothetical protein
MVTKSREAWMGESVEAPSATVSAVGNAAEANGANAADKNANPDSVSAR